MQFQANPEQSKDRREKERYAMVCDGTSRVPELELYRMRTVNEVIVLCC